MARMILLMALVSIVGCTGGSAEPTVTVVSGDGQLELEFAYRF